MLIIFDHFIDFIHNIRGHHFFIELCVWLSPILNTTHLLLKSNTNQLSNQRPIHNLISIEQFVDWCSSLIELYDIYDRVQSGLLNMNNKIKIGIVIIVLINQSFLIN